MLKKCWFGDIKLGVSVCLCMGVGARSRLFVCVACRFLVVLVFRIVISFVYRFFHFHSSTIDKSFILTFKETNYSDFTLTELEFELKEFLKFNIQDMIELSEAIDNCD